MKKLFFVVLFSLILPLSIAPLSFAATDFLEKSCVNTPGVGACAEANTKGGRTGATTVIKNIITTLLYLVGAIAVIMIVYSGFRYVTSAGDAAAVQSAKSTLTYAVVGLVVSMMAFAIVMFVSGSLSSPVTTAPTTTTTKSPAAPAKPGEKPSSDTTT